MRSCFGLRDSIGKNAGERRHFGNPAPILFALEFNREHRDPSAATAIFRADAKGQCTVSASRATFHVSLARGSAAAPAASVRALTCRAARGSLADAPRAPFWTAKRECPFPRPPTSPHIAPHVPAPQNRPAVCTAEGLPARLAAARRASGGAAEPRAGRAKPQGFGEAPQQRFESPAPESHPRGMTGAAATVDSLKSCSNRATRTSASGRPGRRTGRRGRKSRRAGGRCASSRNSSPRATSRRRSRSW